MKVAMDYFVTPSVRSAVMKVLRQEKVEGHEQEESFVKEYCKHFGRKFAIAVSSGTAGLQCALLACNVGRDNEVILPPNTDWSVLYSVLYTGAHPVFSDVEYDTQNLDPALIEEKITPRTKAILAISTAGHPMNFEPLLDIAKSHNLMVVNDGCQALGARYKGEYAEICGDISVSSFGYRKHLAAGHLGIVATDNEELAEKTHEYSHQGEGESYHPNPLQNYINPLYANFDTPGFMYGPSELHCAVGRVQLKKFVTGSLGSEKRRRNAAYYTKSLNAKLPYIGTPIEKDWAYHTYLRYIIRVKQRNELFSYLRKKDIEAFIHYSTPLPSYTLYPHQDDSWKQKFPVTYKLSKEVLTLPSWPTLTSNQREYVVNSLVEFYKPKRSK
jgi:dTDP-4-amino-4,6-dideoxygalactose transaminase